MLAPRERQRIHHPVPAKQRTGEPLELGIEEGEVEGRVMHDQHGAFDEADEIVGALMEARLGRQELDGEPVHLVGLLRHVALGVEVAMPHFSGRNAVDQLDAADLDDAMA